MVRVNEIDQHLVSDIVVGYYNRQHFRDSQLLADRHSLGPKSRSQAATKPILRRNDSDANSSNSDPEEDAEDGSLQAAPDGLCLPPPLDDGDRELVPQLKLRTSTTPAGEGGENLTLTTVAGQRRERRRGRRQAHQDRIRTKQAEHESERRRMRADKERRDREVARAVREAEDAERVRLLREAQEAEDAAPVAARLMRTMQRKAAGAVAAAKARTAAAAGVAGGAEGGGSTQQAVGTGDPAYNNSRFRRDLTEKNHPLLAPNAPDEDEFPANRRPSQVRFDKEQRPLERSHGDGLELRRRSNDGDGRNLGGTTVKSEKRESKGEAPVDEGKVGAALTTDTKSRRQRPKKGSKAGADPPPEGNDATVVRATTPPFPRAREKAAAAASATITVSDMGGGNSTSDAVVASTLETAATLTPPPQAKEARGDTDFRRRKPSEERVGEPRAVFMHRASMVPFSTDAAAAGEAASGQVAGAVAGEEAGATHQRRRSTKGRVGSVLPT